MDSAVWVAVIGAVPVTMTAVAGLTALRRGRLAEQEKERFKREAEEQAAQDEDARRQAEHEKHAAVQLAADESQRADHMNQLMMFYAHALQAEREENGKLRAALRRRPPEEGKPG